MALARHQWDARWCDLLERIAVGESAETALRSFGRAKAAGIAILPCWIWVTPEIDVGRQLESSGRTLPVRIAWSVPGHVVVVRRGDGPVAIQWKAKGLGVQRSGEVKVFLDDAAVSTFEVEPGAEPADRAVPAIPIAKLRSHLRRLADDGRSARWETLSILQDYARAIAPKRLSSVTKEILDHERSTGGGELLDTVDLETVVDRYVLGDGSMASGSRALSLVSRCLEPSTFARVDPLHFVRRAIHRDIEEGIRHAIGDPHVGPKVRALVRAHGMSDIASVVRTYRAQYPADHLGPRRAATALTVPLTSMRARPSSPEIESIA